MFSSPAIRSLSHENADNLVARKPGNASVNRKAFTDRKVNANTSNAKLQSKTTNCLTEDDLNCYDYTFSSKEVEDDYMNICGKTERFNKNDILNILHIFRNGRNVKTPPPKEKKKFNHPPTTIEEDPFWLDLVPKSPKVDLGNSFEEVSKPNMDFDDLDMSI